MGGWRRHQRHQRHQVATRLPNHRPGAGKSGKSRGMASPNGVPTSMKPGRCHALRPAGREGGPLVTASARCSGKLGRRSNTQQSGAGNRRQRLVRHIRGHSVGLSTPSSANGGACVQRWASTTERKNFRLGHDAFRPIHREQRGPAPFGFPAQSPCRAAICTARVEQHPGRGVRARKERGWTS